VLRVDAVPAPEGVREAFQIKPGASVKDSLAAAVIDAEPSVALLDGGPFDPGDDAIGAEGQMAGGE